MGTLSVCLDSRSIWWFVFCVVTFGTLTIIVYHLLRKRFHVVAKNNDFYVVEDVFINVHEVNVFTNRLSQIGYRKFRGPIYDFEIKFSHNGICKLTLFDKKEPEEIDADYSAVFFSQPGDKFYLLMSKSNKEELIIKAFNAKYYKLAEEDFDYLDGKYYPKKHNS